MLGSSGGGEGATPGARSEREDRPVHRKRLTSVNVYSNIDGMDTADLQTDSPAVTPRVAIIGAGVIGESWAIAFLRGGYRVALHDADESVASAAGERVLDKLAALRDLGLCDARRAAHAHRRLSIETTLDAAVNGVVHVQENAAERLDVKKTLFGRLDRCAPHEATIASSTSALLPSSFIDGLPGAHRCLVAHPLNPPHLVPAVEIVPAPATSDESVVRTATLLERIGQRPFRLSREIEGFVMNRLQGALLSEAFRLIDAGFVDISGIDSALVHGLGLRWSRVGPIETIDLNAPNGVADFFTRYGEAYQAIADGGKVGFEWSDSFGARLESMRRERVPADELDARRHWRDRELLALAVFRDSREAAPNEPPRTVTDHQHHPRADARMHSRVGESPPVQARVQKHTRACDDDDSNEDVAHG